MALGINTNLASINSARNLNRSNEALQKTLGKIASGHRINQAGDDAAGLAISEGLRAELRSLQQAQRNANDGVSLVQTADAALGTVDDSLARMRELSVQSANGTLSDTDRQALQTEFNALREEIGRIANTTEFNGRSLLNDASGSVSLQVGTDAGNSLSVGLGDTRPAALGIAASDISTSGGAQSALGAIDSALTSVNTVRSSFGATTNRLQTAISNTATMRENLEASNSRIRDADIAEETARLAAGQILGKAGVSVLAQSNRLNQAALRLLG